MNKIMTGLLLGANILAFGLASNAGATEPTTAGPLGAGMTMYMQMGGNPGDGATTGGHVTYRALEEDAATAHHHAVIADVSFGIATVMGAAALYLALSGSHRDGARAGTPRTVAVDVGPTRASIEVRF